MAKATTIAGKRKKAVVQCLDANYLPYALHLMWQIDRLTPHRDFDLVIASLDDLIIPPSLADTGILFHKLAERFPERLVKPDKTKATYARIHIPVELADRYDRILYLDPDIVFEGGDLNRLLAADIGAHPFAVARTAREILWPRAPAKEFQIAGMGNLPYFSTGVMLIDTDRYVADAMAERVVTAAETYPEAQWLADQSLFNLACKGRFAELSPVWNWCIPSHFAILGQDLPIRFRHFNFKDKPWNDPKGLHAPAYHDTYRRFFEAYMPEALDLLVAPPRPAVLDTMRMVRRLMNFMKFRKPMAAFYNRFRDEWDIKL